MPAWLPVGKVDMVARVATIPGLSEGIAGSPIWRTAVRGIARIIGIAPWRRSGGFIPGGRPQGRAILRG